MAGNEANSVARERTGARKWETSVFGMRHKTRERVREREREDSLRVKSNNYITARAPAVRRRREDNRKYF